MPPAQKQLKGKIITLNGTVDAFVLCEYGTKEMKMILKFYSPTIALNYGQHTNTKK